MCYDMGGFFLKVAQVVGKPDLAPAACVRKLVTLCDQAPGTPSNVVRFVLENELNKSIDEIFERFDWDPIGSASIAQVHRARLKLGFAYNMTGTAYNMKVTIIFLPLFACIYGSFRTGIASFFLNFLFFL